MLFRSILEENIAPNIGAQNTLKPIKDGIYEMPVDRRYKLPLARFVDHEYLRHDMVLSPEVEYKIGRIEKENLARERLAEFGLKSRQKILLYGPPGCGKSMVAERIAWDLGLPFYKVRFETLLSSYLGESAVNLQRLFESIEEFPSVLLLDEFDMVGKQRSTKNNDVGEIHRIVNILLGLLEEYKGDGILIATTNLEDSLDKALFRRFDDVIEMPLPGKEEIEAVLKMAFSALHLDESIQLVDYAHKMVGLSYANIVKIAEDAAKRAIIDSDQKVSKKHLDNALAEALLHKV